MKILVTGGTGFTGTALVRRLLSDGHSVVVLDQKEGLAGAELKRRGAEVILVAPRGGGREIEVKLPERFTLNPSVRGAVKTAPGVVLVEDL